MLGQLADTFGLALGEERRAGLASKKIIKTV
jgi:hypothetical protein